MLVFDVMLSQDFQPVQMHIFSLWDFIQRGCVNVALSVNAAALLLEDGVTFSKENQVEFHESCHYRVQILLLVTH